MLQSDPVDDGHAGKDAVKVIGITLRHRQRLATAFRRSHEIQFGRRVAVGAQHQGDGGIPHPLVGAMRKILERLVIERKHLRRLARLGLVAGIRAISDEAARQRRRHAERIGRRQARPVISTPLNPPPPYCSERPFHSTGRFTWNLIGGALGSDGAIWPSTLQNSGLAGVTRAAGVGPLSATASGVGAIMEADSIRTALSVGRIRSLQVAAGSPIIFAAIASAPKSEVAATSASQLSPRAHVELEALHRFPHAIVLQPRFDRPSGLQWFVPRGRQTKYRRATAAGGRLSPLPRAAEGGQRRLTSPASIRHPPSAGTPGRRESSKPACSSRRGISTLPASSPRTGTSGE